MGTTQPGFVNTTLLLAGNPVHPPQLEPRGTIDRKPFFSGTPELELSIYAERAWKVTY